MPKLKSRFQAYALLFCFEVVGAMSLVLSMMTYIAGTPLWESLLVVACSVGVLIISTYMIIKIIKEARRKGLL